MVRDYMGGNYTEMEEETHVKREHTRRGTHTERRQIIERRNT